MGDHQHGGYVGVDWTAAREAPATSRTPNYAEAKRALLRQQQRAGVLCRSGAAATGDHQHGGYVGVD